MKDGARDLNVKETPSKPKRGRPTEIKRDITKTSQSGLREGLTRATFIIREDTLDKLKERAYTDRKKLKDLDECSRRAMGMEPKAKVRSF